MVIRSPKDLALTIQTQRKKQKLSQTEVGKSVGLKQQTISEFELNPEGTKLSTLFQILAAVNMEITISPKNVTLSNKKQWDNEW